MDMEMSNINNCLSFPLNLSSAAVRSNHNPKKKRTKFLRLITSGPPKPKTTRRPDPTAPKITRPCTECGKKFWSWKALFGHMRCHPERQWRGINPPPNFRQQPEEDDPIFTEEDQEVAACLLILANQRGLPEYSNSSRDDNRGMPEYSTSGEAYAGDGAGPSSFRFECSSCKKVFNSHQALGGHRASHKNVKGCYANTKKDEEEEEGLCLGTDMSSGHKCSVCSRIFSSGQALGGHKRCHLEKMVSASGLGTRVCGLDLNFPADPLVEEDYDHHHDSSSYSPSFGPLDLRLGL